MADKTVTVNLRASIAQYLTSMGAASKATSAFRGSLTTVGMGLTKFVTLPVLAAGAASVKAALDYETAFTRIRTVTTATAGDIAKYRDQLKGLAAETGVAATDLAEGLYFIVQPSLTAAQTLSVLERSAKASALGLGEMGTIGMTVAQAMNAYAKSGLTAAEATDILTQAVMSGVAEPDEYAGALGRILPIASKAGVTFDQVAASLASLSAIGLDVNEGTTAMRGLLQSLVTPTAQTADAFKKLGVSAQQVLTSFQEEGIIATLRMLEVEARKVTNTEAQFLGIMRDLVPNVRALTGELGLTGQEAKIVDEIFANVADSAGTLDEAFKKMEKDPAHQMRQALAKLQNVAIEVGAQLLPVVTDIVEQFGNLAAGFSRLSPAMQSNIVQWGLIAAAAGPALLIFGKLTSLIIGLFSPMGLLTVAIAGVAFALLEAHLNEQKFIQGTQQLAGAVQKGAVTMEDMARETRRLINQYDSLALKQAAAERGTRAMEVVQRILRQRIAEGVRVLRQWGGQISAADQATLNALMAMGDYRAAMALINRLLGGMSQGLRNYASAYDDIAAAASRAGQAIEAAQRQAAGGMPSPPRGNKQHGGPVARTGAFMVGEAGPEMVLLPGGSYVVPNHQLTPAARSGGAMTVLNIGTIELPNVENAEEFYSELGGIGRNALSRRPMG